jgi:nucleotide-binding universal stress UspA family protein
VDIKRILFATDFSEASETALGAAASIARDNQATLLVLHVSQTEDYPVGESVDEDPQPPEDEIKQLKAIVRRIKNVNCEYKWVHCDGSYEAETIVDTADKEHADMIVVGTHGRQGLSHLLAGSVAERVIREAKCPVLAVRQMKPSSVKV